MKTLEEKLDSRMSMEVLDVELDMLDNLPDDEDGTMPLSFDDNGGLADGNCYLLADYTDAQRTELINRGATVRRAVKLNYVNKVVDDLDEDDNHVCRSVLEASDYNWTAMQIANEVYVVVDEPTTIDKILYAVMTAGEIEDTYGLQPGTVRQALGRGHLQGRKSGDIWLISRLAAEERWNDRRKS